MSRRSAGAKTIEELRDEQEEARQERVNLMFIFANRHKRLPTLREMGTMFGDESEMSWRSSSRQELRRSAFGLRKLSDLGRKHIPYPVPEEYRADDCF